MASKPDSAIFAVTLFVQAPEGPNGNVANDNGSGNGNSNRGIDLAWIPEPLQKICLGKTLSQCGAMDFCIRTTTKTVAMCRNLAIPLSRLPSYPRGMSPPRVMSLSFYKLTPGGPYQPLVDAYKSLPSSGLKRLSMDARIKARIRYTHSANNDSIRARTGPRHRAVLIARTLSTRLSHAVIPSEARLGPRRRMRWGKRSRGVVAAGKQPRDGGVASESGTLRSARPQRGDVRSHAVRQERSAECAMRCVPASAKRRSKAMHHAEAAVSQRRGH